MGTTHLSAGGRIGLVKKLAFILYLTFLGCGGDPSSPDAAPRTDGAPFDTALFDTAPPSDGAPSDTAVDTPRDASADVPLDAPAPEDAGTVCGNRCNGRRTHWNPYVQACITDPSVDTDGFVVCGCDGNEYPSPGFAARRGIRDSVQGRCGEELTPCGTRDCTSEEYCDSTDCESSTRRCAPRPTLCEPPEEENWSCGCDGQWYADDCHRRMEGRVGFSFDDTICGSLPFDGAYRRAFMTRHTSRGNIGGLSAADRICGEEARAAGLEGTWLALLADETHGPERVVGDTAIADMDGDVIFESLTDVLRLHTRFEYRWVSGRTRGPNQFADGESERPDLRIPLWFGFGPRPMNGHCSGWTVDGGDGLCGYFDARGGRIDLHYVECDCGHFPERHFLCVEQ